MPRKILIISHPLDFHGTIIHYALQKGGNDAVLWFPSDFPAHQYLTFSILGDTVSLPIPDVHGIFHERFDVVWNRRTVAPSISSTLHQQDQQGAIRQSQSFIEFTQQFIAPDAKWINPYTNSTRSKYKPLQLSFARKCGFMVPQTIVTNDPTRIRSFFQECTEQVVAKPLLSEFRELEKGGINAIYAELLKIDLLMDDASLRAMPYIFQKKIHMEFEVRVTIFGGKIVATKITRTDNRDAIDQHLGELRIEPYLPSPDLAARCRLLVESMGLAFACIDLAIDAFGEVYFLELNQSGQFLWIEERIPEINILAAFCDFLEGSDCKFGGDRTLAEILSDSHFHEAIKDNLVRAGNINGLLPNTSVQSVVKRYPFIPMAFSDNIY